MKTAQVRSLLKDFLPLEAHPALDSARTIGEFRLVLNTWTAAQKFHERQLQEYGVRLAEESPPTRLRDASAANDAGDHPWDHILGARRRAAAAPAEFRAWDEPAAPESALGPSRVIPWPPVVGAPASEWRRVFITRIGANKIGVIKAIREITGLDLKEAKAMADAAQGAREQLVGEFRHADTADIAARALIAAGADVRSEMIGGMAPAP